MLFVILLSLVMVRMINELFRYMENRQLHKGGRKWLPWLWFTGRVGLTGVIGCGSVAERGGKIYGVDDTNS